MIIIYLYSKICVLKVEAEKWFSKIGEIKLL